MIVPARLHGNCNASIGRPHWSIVRPLPGLSEFSALETRLAQRLLDFNRLDETRPRGRTAVEWVGTGRQSDNALSGRVAIRDRTVIRYL